MKIRKFTEALALLIVVLLLGACITTLWFRPEKQTTPAVTQFLSMASSLLSFIVGFYFSKKTDEAHDSLNNPKP